MIQITKMLYSDAELRRLERGEFDPRPSAIRDMATELLAARKELAELRAKAEVRAVTIVTNVGREDAESNEPGAGIVFSASDWEFLEGLPDGTKLYTAPPAQAVSVPEGWKLVQRGHVTPEMEAAGNSATNDVYWSVVDVFDAMLAASPSPEPSC